MLPLSSCLRLTPGLLLPTTSFSYWWQQEGAGEPHSPLIKSIQQESELGDFPPNGSRSVGIPDSANAIPNVLGSAK